MNTVVGQITASDVDANTTLQFALSGTGASNFAISNTGEITLASALDFETLNSYTLTVQVSDGDLTDEATVNISVTDVNENQTPVIAAQTFSIIENSANGTNVGTVIASDPDAGQTLTYEITAGNINNAFAIDNNGALTVAGSLDFETLNTYTLTVQVTDNANPSASASATITANITDEICSPISTLECNQILVNLPVNLEFDGTEGKLANTGFTMVDAYLGTRLAVDGTPSNPDVRGFEPSKLSVANGRLSIQTNKGIAFQANNNQINTLGVQFGVTNQFKIETALINPFVGSNAEQAGIWYGLNDQTFIKLVINNGQAELRREINNASSTSNNAATNPDQRISVPIQDANTSIIYLRLVINTSNNSAEGFYSTDGVNYTSTGTNVDYTTPHVVLPASLTTGNQYAGLFATHRNSNTSRTYTFENFKIEDTTPVNNAPIVANPIADQNAISGIAFNFAVPANTFTDADNQTLTLSASLADNSPLPAWLSFANGTFSGTPQTGDIANLIIKVNATDGQASVSDEFALNVSAPVNVAPTVANPIADQNATVGTAYSFTVPTNTFSDANNDILILTASLADNSPLPTWLSFANGTFSGTPQASDVANLTIKVNAADAEFNVSDEFALDVSTAIIPCAPISILPCAQIKVPLNAPFVLNFNGSEGGLSNTGFTMVDAPSLRIAADGPISNPAVPGYEPSKLSFNDGKLIINANKGIAFVKPAGAGVISTETNSQINTLGVGFDANDFNFSVQTTITNPYTDNGSDSEQAGIWFGLDEANFIKLVAARGGQVEMRVEVGDNSENSDNIAVNVGAILHTSNVTLRMQVNISALTVTGFYKLNNGTEVSVGTLPIPATFLNGKTINGEGISFAGIFATKRREAAATQVNYTFEDFSITPDILVNQAPVIANQIFNVNENAGAGTLVGTVVATAPEANQTLTYSVTPSDVFNINAQGQIIVVGALDFETTPSYNLNVTVTDNGIPQALSTSASITVNLNNLDPQIEITPSELVFDGLKGNTIGPKSVTVQNIGGDALTITGVNISGTNADKFTTIATPITLGIGESTIVQSNFVPNGTLGYLNASLDFVSNDLANPTKTVGLYGLSKNGLEGNNEPTLHNVVQTLGYGINVGWTSPLAIGTSPLPLGDEVLEPLFQKAGIGEVTILPVARYSPVHKIFFGYYENQGGTPLRTEVGELQPGNINEPDPQHQTLFPNLLNGATSFEIDNRVFGIYVLGLASRFTYTEDALNTVPNYPAHAVRIYPMKDRQGNPIPNSYLICFEDATNGDYQDYVFVLSNVKPAGSTLGTLQFASTPNSTSLQIGQTGTIQNTLSTSNSANVSATLNAVDNATSAIPTWLKIDGNAVNNVNVNADAPVTFEFDATGLAVGTYTATVTASAAGYDEATIQLTLNVTNPIVIKVNFQDNTVAAPIGYLKDIGESFGNRTAPDQGSGQYNYGWVNPANGQPSDLILQTRTRAGTLDLRLRTLIHMDHPTLTQPRGNWEIALPMVLIR
ncbi:MAG: hypothetical protein HC912_00085 [Saprospiraceae bacterium]|nr:hypothetical protein [Saprospiraceae bacterium]